jgi:hypothetical protein
LSLESVDDVVQDIDEDDFIARVVEEFGDEATVCCELCCLELYLLDCSMTYRPMLPPPKWTAFFPVMVTQLRFMKLEELYRDRKKMRHSRGTQGGG